MRVSVCQRRGDWRVREADSVLSAERLMSAITARRRADAKLELATKYKYISS